VSALFLAATSTTSSTATPNGWGGTLPIIPHPAELIVGLVFFGIVYWAMAKYVVPRLEAVYAERTAAIEGGIEKAERAQAEAAAALEQYRGQLAEARGEATKIREKARAEGVQIIESMREQAKAEADRILSSAQAQIAAERQTAVTQLRSDIGTLATDLASRIVGESLTDSARQSRVVDRFLDELEQSEPASSSASGQAS
jgi:F-type H+-transporting ATPase subunit b